MKHLVCAIALLTTFSSYAKGSFSNGMSFEEFNRGLREYPNPQKLIGKYTGTTDGSFGATKKCQIEINDLDSTSVHFEASVEKGYFSKSMQRLASIRGYKKYYFEQALSGELNVKKSEKVDSFSYNYKYSLPHHDRTDFGTITIHVNNENEPLEFIHTRRDHDEIRCENLVRN